MPAHLTRHIFRRLLANEPIVYRGCLRRQLHSRARIHHAWLGTSTPGHGAQSAPHSQRRTFFNFSMFRKKQKESKDADIAPGVEDMMQFAKLERMNARLPHPQHVLAALRKFFAFIRGSTKTGIEDIQAELVLQCLRYCMRTGQALKPDGHSTFVSMVRYAAPVLRRPHPPSTSFHADLAKAIYVDAKEVDVDDKTVLDALQVCCKILSRTGRFSEARELIDDVAQAEVGNAAASDTSSVRDAYRRLWSDVLYGCAAANDGDGVRSTLRLLRDRGWAGHDSVARAMLVYSLHGSDAGAIEKWFLEAGQADEAGTSGAPSAEASGPFRLSEVLQWCLAHGELELGHKIVRRSLGNDPPKQVWDTVFVWAAGTGKGADEINRMLDVMEASNKSKANRDEWRLPDIQTINGLVNYAVSRNDPYLAERFIALGKARGIEPDAWTYVLQMQYRLTVNDVDGALVAYKNLQAAGDSSEKDGPTVNKLIVALCQSQRHDFDTIMNVAADLSDRQVRFEAETVSRLALLHLSRDELHDVIDLLNTHSFHFSSTERESIRNSLVGYCTDPATRTPRAWDAYCILRNIFDETPRPQRTKLMEEFFRRGRPDMAVNIFNAMRAHSRSDTYPTTDTYVSAFLNAAKIKDLDSLEVIHNQLKLDYNIDPTTYLRNALIIGYSGCGQPRRGLSQWDDIVASKEGPSYNSIHIALRACERSPFGDIKAKDIWAKLRRMKIDLDQSMWASYAGALVGNGDIATAIDTIEKAEKDNEAEIDAFLIGSMYNGAPGQNKQKEVEEWAKEAYPNVWSKLESIGFEEDDNGMKVFKLQRDVSP
ncbi:uncharacterized protein MYCGRDRAFT_72989 [Zymoseptoria tritici IPO323]|uniref:Complex I intermediate-associated protein 84 n=1 Tax=Zymoseptoria tritici (strain CBS 115943 / IPO323) TaxID=336722 RepID=F9XD29_ZYMTI|nr:uncharacterized protein MYCGRDRAFT_72989 [Zymoseptoria tritici IPO323]EGP86864.1 hypothetical protein MYCGRDRAFT_72989 [Zymoseptoria tritici IPO323]